VTIHGRFLCCQYREGQRPSANTEMLSSSGKVFTRNSKTLRKIPDERIELCGPQLTFLRNCRLRRKRHTVVTPLIVAKLSRGLVRFPHDDDVNDVNGAPRWYCDHATNGAVPVTLSNVIAITFQTGHDHVAADATTTSAGVTVERFIAAKCSTRQEPTLKPCSLLKSSDHATWTSPVAESIHIYGE
jgi:hypothetical protein